MSDGQLEKKEKEQQTSSKKVMAVTIIAAALIGAVVGAGAVMVQPGKTVNDMIADFYETENAVHVSPHSLRGKMDKGIADFVLVDLRSAEEYEAEHIVGAVSIPAYKNKYESDYGAVDRIVSAFRNLSEQNPGKSIIVYCYSIPCMTGRKVGKMLAEKGIFVQLLGIGWNEWRYFWNLWNHEHEWNSTTPEEYITSGPEPGVPKIKNATAPCTVGELGC